MVSTTKYMMPQSGVSNQAMQMQAAIASGLPGAQIPVAAPVAQVPQAPLTAMSTTAPVNPSMPMNTAGVPQTGLIGAEQAR